MQYGVDCSTFTNIYICALSTSTTRVSMPAQVKQATKKNSQRRRRVDIVFKQPWIPL